MLFTKYAPKHIELLASDITDVYIDHYAIRI